MPDERIGRDGEVPPPSETVHLPGPSLQPAIVALGITIMLVGLVISWVLIAIGAITFLIPLIGWIRDTRSDIAELPLEH